MYVLTKGGRIWHQPFQTGLLHKRDCNRKVKKNDSLILKKIRRGDMHTGLTRQSDIYVHQQGISIILLRYIDQIDVK